MTRSVAKGLPMFVRYNEFVRRVGETSPIDGCLSKSRRKAYVEALRQLNPAGWKELGEVLDAWTRGVASAREAVRADDGRTVIRFDTGGVQVLVRFDERREVPRPVDYTLLNGHDGRFLTPCVVDAIGDVMGRKGEAVWDALVKTLSYYEDEYFIVEDKECPGVYFQAWVNHKKWRWVPVDVEYCLGNMAFHFKTRVNTLEALAKMILAMRDGGIPALQDLTRKWVQIFPTPGTNEW